MLESINPLFSVNCVYEYQKLQWSSTDSTLWFDYEVIMSTHVPNDTAITKGLKALIFSSCICYFILRQGTFSLISNSLILSLTLIYWKNIHNAEILLRLYLLNLILQLNTYTFFFLSSATALYEPWPPW